MTQSVWNETFFWLATLAVVAALFLGLDSYRRTPLSYGYGPERRQLFQETLSKARELEASGSYQISANETWHLLHGWSADSGRPRASSRRGILLLPVATPRPLVIELEASPLPEGGQPPVAVEVEYGVNGEPVGRRTLPVGGGLLRFEIAPSMLFRGDNTIFIYRVSRRAEPSPWLRVGTVHVRGG